MKIGIITPMEEEKRLLLSEIKNKNEIMIAGISFIEGELKNHQVILTESGIGKVQATIAATILIEKFNIEVLINTGSAGSLDNDLKIGDIVIGDKFKYFDADNRIFGYQIGQIPQKPEFFSSDVNLINKVSSLKPEIKIGLIVSGDSFVTTDKKTEILNNFPDAISVEMESTAITQTANQFNIPVLVIRSISDTADGSADVNFEEFVVLAGKNSARFLLELLATI